MKSKVFLDTNVVIDHITQRSTYPSEKLFKAIEENQIDAYISVGSMYTITYYTEMFLKKQGYQKPLSIEYLRGILDSLIQIVEIAPLNKANVQAGIENPLFSDIEDSYQYQAALSAECDILLTRNTKDFKGCDASRMLILPPEEYILGL